MVTYLQLGSEQVWHDQVTPPFMTGFLIVPLRGFYNLGVNDVAAAGDNNHLYGRHRSANWDRQSRYCTDRSYGTVDARDHAGDQNWYRAVDTGISGPTLWDACHRVDAAVRAGELPEVAEWFGSFDGQTVVGWYEGHPSSSDSSHLTHLHVGFWNEYANDFQVMQRVFGIITGQEEQDMTPEQARQLANTANLTYEALILGHDTMQAAIVMGDGSNAFPAIAIIQRLKALEAKVDALSTSGGGSAGPTAAEIAKAVNDDAAARLAE